MNKINFKEIYEEMDKKAWSEELDKDEIEFILKIRNMIDSLVEYTFREYCKANDVTFGYYNRSHPYFDDDVTEWYANGDEVVFECETEIHLGCGDYESDSGRVSIPIEYFSDPSLLERDKEETRLRKEAEQKEKERVKKIQKSKKENAAKAKRYEEFLKLQEEFSNG